MGYEQEKEKTEGRRLRRGRASGLFESQKVESGMTGMEGPSLRGSGLYVTENEGQ
jgi:hypothetical protein